MILATPIISALKCKYPQSRLYFIAGSRNHIVIKHNPNISKIIIWNKLPNFLIKNLMLLRFNKFDYYIDPKDHYSRESNIIARIVRSKVKIGLNKKQRIFDISIPDEKQNEGLHFTQRVFRAFEPLGIVLEPNQIPKPELFYSSDNFDYVDKFLREIELKECNFIVFNISASHPRKTFNENVLRSIFTKIKFDLPIILTFDVKDTVKALELKGNFKFLHLFFSRNLLDIFGLIENSYAVITPDTSIVHIATAYSKPTLAFYSGLDDFFCKFHPNNSKSIVVRAEKGDPGIQSISVSQIINSIEFFLQKIKEIL